MNKDLVFVILFAFISLIFFCAAGHYIGIYKSYRSSTSAQEKQKTLTTSIILGAVGFIFLFAAFLVLILG
ncbi:MAG: hypothetical protein IJX04_04875 [Oscillospiraceae bacterium]|nr:hypothetical protein [Oscillospiraceae bacterium]